jgi:hypothetical protein
MGHISHNHGGVLPAAVINYIGAWLFSYISESPSEAYVIKSPGSHLFS